MKAAKQRPAPLPPGSTIGILGGGQLGRMLALAAARLGFKCVILAPERDAPAAQVAFRHMPAEFDDERGLRELAGLADVITFEWESVPVETVAFLENLVPVAPSSAALRTTQDRFLEKSFIAGLGIPVAPFADIASADDLSHALKATGLPAILKTRRFGYDGKGQVNIRAAKEAKAALASLKNAAAILETHIDFDYEASIIGCRNRAGKFDAYDLTENRHKNHILNESRVPSRGDASLETRARDMARAIAEGLGYVGVFGVEFFVRGDELIVNEIAPRVHNSGHWTLDACLVSQFEQHVRCIAGWPLGSVSRHHDATMINLVGADIDDWPDLAGEDAALHIYGKAEARKGRKMGHATRLFPLGSLGKARQRRRQSG